MLSNVSLSENIHWTSETESCKKKKKKTLVSPKFYEKSYIRIPQNSGTKSVTDRQKKDQPGSEWWTDDSVGTLKKSLKSKVEEIICWIWW